MADTTTLTAPLAPAQLRALGADLSYWPLDMAERHLAMLQADHAIRDDDATTITTALRSGTAVCWR